jgi:hypothetical protein
MRSMVSLLAVVVIVLLSYKLYFSRMTQATGSASPVATIDIAGVKNDLLAIGHAEQIYQAEHGSYASFDELVSSGGVTMRKPGRDGYTYDVETSDDGFRVVAHCPSATQPGCIDYSVDRSMEIHAEQ